MREHGKANYFESHLLLAGVIGLGIWGVVESVKRSLGIPMLLICSAFLAFGVWGMWWLRTRSPEAHKRQRQAADGGSVPKGPSLLVDRVVNEREPVDAALNTPQDEVRDTSQESTP